MNTPNSEIKTPRTDAQVELENPIGIPGNTAIVSTSFARQLEQELQQAQSAKQHMEACRSLLKCPSDDVLYSSIEQLQQELQQAREEVARLESASHHMMACRALLHTDNNDVLFSSIQDLQSQLTQAQQRIKDECTDWAEDHTFLQSLCRKAGCTELEVEGSSYGVPGIQTLAEILLKKLTEVRTNYIPREEYEKVVNLFREEHGESWTGGCEICDALLHAEKLLKGGQ